MADIWDLPEDTKKDPAEEQTIKRPEKPLPLPDEITGRAVPTGADPAAPLLGLLWKTAEAVPVSLLTVLKPKFAPSQTAVTVTVTGDDPVTEPYGMTLSDLLQTLAKPMTSLQHKWHGHILLLRDAVAPLQQPATPPGG